MTGLQPGGIAMNGNRYYGVRVEGAKYGVGFGSALAIDLLYQQPFDPVGDHPRHPGLALRDLCRAVWMIQPTAQTYPSKQKAHDDVAGFLQSEAGCSPPDRYNATATGIVRAASNGDGGAGQ
jgi:hypothetical protein